MVSVSFEENTVSETAPLLPHEQSRQSGTARLRSAGKVRIPAKIAANREGSQFEVCSRAPLRSLLLFSLFGLLSCAKAGAPSQGIAYPAEKTRGGPPPVMDQFLPLTAPKSAVAPPPAPRPPALSFRDTPFTGAAPLLVEQAASDASWVALCQARKDSNGDGALAASVGPRGDLSGDALTRFVVTPGEELAIDDFLLADASGRYAVFVQQGALVLWDSASRTRSDLSALGADARLSAESFAAVRTLSFDAESRRLLYVRLGKPGNEQATRLILRNLADGNELELDPGPVPIWRAQFDRGGAFIVLQVMSEDTNKNGKLGFPAPLLTAPRSCSGAPGRYQVFVDRGDKPKLELLPVTGGAPIQNPDLVMPLGDGWLLRDETGALLDERAGKRRVLAPASCKGRIVHADPRRDLYIVGCPQKKTGRMSLELVSRGERKPLGIDLASLELDREATDSPRLVPLYPGTESALFDADRRQLIPLQPGDVVLATREQRALVRRGKSLLFYDAETRTEQATSASLERFPDVLVTPPFVYVSPVVVNLETASVVGSLEQRPLALASDGRLLVAETPSNGSALASGPLRWVSATP